MSKLNQKEELLGQIDTWLVCCKHDGIKVYGSCKKCPCEEICKQAEQQIREMIQKPGVTEEWIEEKARMMINIIQMFALESQGKLKEKSDIFKTTEDFIRSLVEEVK